MAFVNRSQRNINLLTTEVSDVGPGDYVLEGAIKPKNNESYQAPFNSSEQRQGFFDHNNNPGPGSYHPIIHSNVMKNKRDMNYCYIDQSNDNIFFTGEERFKSTKDKDIPGPGRYDLISAKSVRKEKYLYEKNKPKLLSLSNQRVLSIPSKATNFGYQVSSNGLVSLANDPDKLLKFSGDSKDSIAPNQYKLTEPFKNNNIINWKLSNMKRPKKIDSATANTRIDSGTTMHDDLIINSGREIIKRKAPVIYKNKTLGLKGNDHQEDIDLKLFAVETDDTPGPGAYSPYLPTDFGNYRYRPDYKQNFGSSVARSAVVKRNNYDENQGGVGPGQYFKDENWSKRAISNHREHHNKNKSKDNSNESYKKIIQQRLDSAKNIGPGSYDLDHDLWIKKRVSPIGCFGVHEKRFIEPISSSQDFPGAGSYLGLPTWVEPHKYQTRIIEPVHINQVEKPTIPGVGQYNSEVFHSIDYSVKAKANTKVHVAPFDSNSKRFQIKSQTNSDVGPGQYYRNYNPSNKSCINDSSPPFMSNVERSKKINKLVSIGPGAYNADSYFDWNKKSYNILFA